MRIVVAGGTGLLGRALVARLRAEQHAVTVLTRRPRPGAPNEIGWTPDGTAGPWARAVGQADAIVNLAGASLAGGRWTRARKRVLVDSRVLPTRSLVRAIAAAPGRWRVLVNVSAVGIYGPHGDEIVTEETPPGSDFLSGLVAAWEQEADAAASDETRVIRLRTAPVLSRDGGMLAQMLLPFRFGLGGPFGSGEQYLPWIHRDDWVSMVTWLLGREDLAGAINASSPAPVTNAELARTLGRVLNRPAIARVPAFVLRLALGELSEALLTGQRAMPARAIEAGFMFAYADLESALRRELG